MPDATPPPPPTARLGRHGPVVPALGLGLAAVGRPAYITGGRARDLGPDRSVAALRDRTFAVLDAAAALGIGYLDVARSYGLAEDFLAEWLGTHPGADVVVGSKWGYHYVGDWSADATVHELKDHSRESFARQWAETRSRLGGAVSVYQVHSATFDTGVLDDASLHHDIAALRDVGVLAGVTVSGPRQGDVVRAALDVTVDGEPLFATVQATWNLLERSASDALSEAADAGVGVVVKEALANGRLTDDGDPADAPRARAFAAETGVDTASVALAAAISRPWADVVVSGAVTPDQVRAGVAASHLRVDDALVDADDPADPDDYWAARSRRPWA